jgi:hypothetical protein
MGVFSIGGIVQQQPTVNRYENPKGFEKYTLYDHEFWLTKSHIRLSGYVIWQRIEQPTETGEVFG